MRARQEISSNRLVAVLEAGRAAFSEFELRLLDRTPSTQDVVLAAARSGAGAGFCCVAREQTAGRGRLGRSWVAPRDSSLLVSLLLRPPRECAAQVTLATGLAMCDALEASTGVRAQLRWPNDVVAGDGKLAGILAETDGRGTPPAVAIGIGLNLHVDDFPPGARGTSLHRLVPDPPSWEAVLEALLPAVAERARALATGGIAALRLDLRRRSMLLGRRVDARGPAGPVTGVATDIDDDGALVVLGHDGPVRVISGAVRLADARPGAPPGY